MMQRRLTIEQQRSREPDTVRNLVNLSDPIERVKIYRQRDIDADEEVLRRKRLSLPNHKPNKASAMSSIKEVDSLPPSNLRTLREKTRL